MNIFKIRYSVVTAAVLMSALSGCGKHEAGAPAAAPAPVTTVPRATPVALPANEAVATKFEKGTNSPIALTAKHYVGGSIISPSGGELGAVSVELGTYINTSDGELKVTFCNKDVCSEGTADLLTSLDNKLLGIPLSSPLAVNGGDKLTFKIEKLTGVVPVAIWSYSTSDQASIGIDGKEEAGRTGKFILHFVK
ncbi:hypothetical protein [Aquilutibacter rugosus]|uniref:hypothetical protein n=1 Tax=Aquilutibacter rugosus TaxID=3115820 RepID=UPI002F3F4200